MTFLVLYKKEPKRTSLSLPIVFTFRVKTLNHLEFAVFVAASYRTKLTLNLARIVKITNSALKSCT